MNVYIDIIFMINFILNFLFLYFSTLIVKFYKPIKIYRLLLSSFISSILYILFIYFELVLSKANFLLMELLICISILLAFYPLNKKQFMKTLYTLHIVTFSFGGVLMGLINLFNTSGLGLTITKHNLPIKIFLSSLAIFYIVLKGIQTILKDKEHNNKISYEVELKVNNKILYTKGLYDSGNLLKHNNTAVCIVDISLLKNCFEDRLLKDLKEKTNVFEVIYKFKEYAFFPIYFKAVGTKEGELLGYTTDYIKINDTIYKNIPIGITKDLNEYKFIINSEMGGWNER